jgi:uncharacterized protein (TIGR02757 family)
VTTELALVLEDLYQCYNSRRWVAPDPLQFLYGYPDLADREIVAIVCSCLAYGRVAQIVRNLTEILRILGSNPSELLREISPDRLACMLQGIRHRFAGGRDIAMLLWGASRLQQDHGAVGSALGSYCASGELLEGLRRLVAELQRLSGLEGNHLLPTPSKGSACKRLMLLTRWMVRQDRVDPGGWEHLGAENLIVPLDTHMFAMGRALGFTSRRSADMRAALEVTEGFARMQPRDPVRYDFALTRFGIREDLDREHLVRLLRGGCGRAKAEANGDHRA